VAHRKLSHEGTLVLDCEGLSKFVSDHEPVVALTKLCGDRVRLVAV